MAKDGMFNLIERKNLLVDKSWNESKKMWHIAGPAILAGVCQFSIGLVTVAFVGHLGDTELAAVSAVQNVIEGFVSGFMVRFCLYILQLSLSLNSNTLLCGRLYYSYSKDMLMPSVCWPSNRAIDY